MNVWIEAARPKTLAAGVAPVLVGTAAADRFVAWRFVAALIVALAVQVGVNYANDLFDAESGVDTERRVGPRRAVAAGLVSPSRMRWAMYGAFGVSAVAGLALTAAVGWELLLVGALAFLAALGYSGGPRPYASAGLGELSVFVFFGLVATAGSQYVQDEQLRWVSLAAAVPIGLLASAILVVNNLRDIPTDEEAGKRTLAVRIGADATRRLFQLLILVSFLTVPLVVWAATDAWPLLAWAAVPLAVSPVRAVRREPLGVELIPALAATARLQLGFGVLLAIGLAVAT